MFTGIIETLGKVKNVKLERGNKIFTVECSFASELKIDQSLAHDGVCLTVIQINGNEYKVLAIEESLQKSNLDYLNIDDYINLERATKFGDRLDGHIVQGHVDTVGVCKNIEKKEGSTIFTFEYENKNFITVEKGSITVNGVSLTVINSEDTKFSVAIIPYTLEHTNFKYIRESDVVNLEFDIIGKYIEKLYRTRN